MAFHSAWLRCNSPDTDQCLVLLDIMAIEPQLQLLNTDVQNFVIEYDCSVASLKNLLSVYCPENVSKRKAKSELFERTHKVIRHSISCGNVDRM